jgi:uncharacterized protein YqhQ
MIDVFFILAILVTLVFLIAFFVMIHSLWTIYHQTEHTVLHLGKHHHVK